MKHKWTAYRGESSRGPADPGDLGVGTYYSTSKAYAKCYGTVTKHEVELQSPFFMRGDQARFFVELHGTLRGSWDQRKENAQALTDYLRDMGHDGIVAMGWDSPKDHFTIVVFPPKGA